MKYFKNSCFLVVVTMGLFVFARTREEVAGELRVLVIDQLCSNLDEGLLKFEMTDLDKKFHAFPPDVLVRILSYADTKIAQYKPIIDKRDTFQLKLAVVSLAATAVFVGMLYYYFYKKPPVAPNMQAIKSFYEQRGMGNVVQLSGSISYWHQGTDPLADPEVCGALKKLVDDYNRQVLVYYKFQDSRTWALEFYSMFSVLAGSLGFPSLYNGLYPDYKQRYEKWCQIKQSIERALKNNQFAPCS